MRSTVGFVLIVAALALPVSSQAQIAAPLHILPVIAKVSGVADTDWMTSLSVSNAGPFDADVTAMFFRENQNNLPLLGPTETFALESGQTLTVDDVLGTWFPTQGDTKGFLVLLATATDGGEEAVMLTSAGRIFNNADPSATYGQTVPSTLLGLAVAPARSIMPGARWDDAVRTNVGVINLTLLPLDVLMTTYDANGAVIASASKRIRAFSLGQWSLAQLGADELSTPGRVEVSVDPDTISWDPCIDVLEPDLDDLRGLFTAYMSRVDQVTGDAELIQGQTEWTEYTELCGEPVPTVAHRLPFAIR
jgi:hypothetical protein